MKEDRLESWRHALTYLKLFLYLNFLTTYVLHITLSLCDRDKGFCMTFCNIVPFIKNEGNKI